jgi:hypothetical protein
MLLQEQIATLPTGQRRVVEALLGIHLGTVHTHLQRVRSGHPELYATIMARRADQLEARRRRSAPRAMEHSRQ